MSGPPVYPFMIKRQLVIDDDFLNMQPWANSTVPDGWTKIGTHDINSFVEENANGLRLFSSSAFMGIYRPGLTIGRDYRLTVDVPSVTDGGVTFGATIGGVAIGTVSNPGIHVFEWTANIINLGFKRSSGTGNDLIIRSVKVREIN